MNFNSYIMIERAFRPSRDKSIAINSDWSKNDLFIIFLNSRLHKTTFFHLIISSWKSFRLKYKIADLLSQVTRGYNGERLVPF